MIRIMMNEHLTPTSSRFAIFKAGTHTDSSGRVVSMSVDDLWQIANAYEPDLAAAPLVVGHPELDMPAYGWVKTLTVNGNELVAEAEDVAIEFADMVNQRRFPNRSAAIFLENTPGNPKPGKKYLKHVGFLGASPPAIRGLKPVTFSEQDQALYFNFSLQNEESNMNEEQLKQQAQEISRRETILQEGEAALAARQAQIQREQAVTFAAKLADEGKLLPNEVNGMVELLIELPNNQPLTFSASGTQVSKTPSDFLKGFLSELPQRVKFAEKSADTVANDVTALQFAAPSGVQVDNSRADLFQKATAYQHQNPHVSWLEAVQVSRIPYKYITFFHVTTYFQS